MKSDVLVAIPVYNEQKYVTRVLERVRRYASDILVIDDGSTDETPALLARQRVEVVRHAENRGYGRSMQDAIRWAASYRYDWLITMDCDEQHEPESIPEFLDAIRRDDADVLSGSRYLREIDRITQAPSDRQRINLAITEELNRRLGLSLTDAFCGFKAYRVSAVDDLELDVDGYDFPMQFWVAAVAARLRIAELPIRLIYNDPNRSFGERLDNPDIRLRHYLGTLHAEIVRHCHDLPVSAWRDLAENYPCPCTG